MLPLPVDLDCPPPSPDSPVTVEVARAGFTAEARARVVRGGDAQRIEMPMNVGVVRHPDGLVLVDAGLGLDTRAGTFPGWPIDLVTHTEVPEGEAMVERLDGAGVHRVLLTHMHYDHVGGLLDLPPTTVVAPFAEWQHHHAGSAHVPSRVWDTHDVELVSFAPGGEVVQVLGRPAVDVFGDGLVWLLSTPGHTAGSAAVLVRAADSPYLFVGDTAWVREHLEGGRRPWSTALVVDWKPRELRDSLDWAQTLTANCPDLWIVPGHDAPLKPHP